MRQRGAGRDIERRYREKKKRWGYVGKDKESQ